MVIAVAFSGRTGGFSALTKVLLFAWAVIALGMQCPGCMHSNAGKADNEPKNIEGKQEYNDDKYAHEPEPPENVAALLALLDSCIGGQYVIGGQGDRITAKFLDAAKREKPGAFTKEQLAYLDGIAAEGQTAGWNFPGHYAWDCSGLWWWGAHKLGLFPRKTDGTAYMTYHKYCTPVAKEDLQPGDLVFYRNKENRIVHMGIVGLKGYVYEAVGISGGIVKKCTLEKRVYADIINGGMFTAPEWNIFGRPKIFE